MDPLGSIATGGSSGQISSTAVALGAEKGKSGSSAQQTGASATAQAIRLPEDRVTLSGQQPEKPQPQAAGQPDAKKDSKPGEKTTAEGKSLEDPQIQQQISRLRQIEEKVKAHEAAHKAVGGNLASSASYSYTQGPDGRSYITGGEVQIDMSSGQTPEETIARMQQVIRAALAPSDPSGQDRAVAAQAANQMSQAQQQKAQLASPNAESDPSQPVDPAKEAMRAAVDSDAKGTSNSSTTKNGTDAQVQQAYSNPAVQGKKQSTSDQGGPAMTPTPSRQQPGSRQSADSPLISAFA